MKGEQDRRPLSRNWFQIIADLHKAGIPNSELARKLNVTRSAVLRWKLGSEPSYYYGEKILYLHSQHCRVNECNVTVAGS